MARTKQTSNRVRSKPINYFVYFSEIKAGDTLQIESESRGFKMYVLVRSIKTEELNFGKMYVFTIDSFVEDDYVSESDDDKYEDEDWYLSDQYILRIHLEWCSTGVEETTSYHAEVCQYKKIQIVDWVWRIF
jgi:hypothetical protein